MEKLTEFYSRKNIFSSLLMIPDPGK